MPWPRRSTIFADPAESLTLLAPVPGTVVELAVVADPVFASHMLGPGVAVRPDGPCTVVAPAGGEIVAGRSHAFVVRAAPGREVLVHLGLDTMDLPMGLTTAVGQTVAAGDVVGRWEYDVVRAAGRSPVCPLVAMQALPIAVEVLVAPGRVVAAGDPLLVWHPMSPVLGWVGFAG